MSSDLVRMSSRLISKEPLPSDFTELQGEVDGSLDNFGTGFFGLGTGFFVGFLKRELVLPG